MSSRRILAQMIDPPHGFGRLIGMLSQLSLAFAGIMMLIMFQMILYAGIMNYWMNTPTVLSTRLILPLLGYAVLLIIADSLRRGQLIQVRGGPLGGRRLEILLSTLSMAGGIALIAGGVSALPQHLSGAIPLLSLAFPTAGCAVILAALVRLGRLRTIIRREAQQQARPSIALR